MSQRRIAARLPTPREADPVHAAALRERARARTADAPPPADAGAGASPEPDERWTLCQWTWWPSPAQQPGPYEPTIVVHHGGRAGRTFKHEGVFVRDLPMFRTPAFWRRVRPHVIFELVSYPNGYIGKPTRTKRTREHESLGTWWPDDPAPNLPMGIGLPPAPVVVVDIEGVGRVVAELAEAMPGEAPRYVGRVEAREQARVVVEVEQVNVDAGSRRR